MARDDTVTPTTWASTVLHGLGIPQTPGAVKALVGWTRAEGGHWNNDAKYNPLNTTQPEPGAGNTGSQGNIKVYTSWQQGVDATVKTLENGKYAPILAALRAGNASQVANAIGQTPWGTSGRLVQQAIASTPSVAGAQPLATGAPTAATPAETPAATTAAPAVDSSGSQALLAQLQQKQAAPVSLTAAPSFAAQAPTPAGYQGQAASATPQAPQQDTTLQALLQAATQSGQGSSTPTQETSSTATPAAAASTSPAKGFKAGDPVIGGTGIGGEHDTGGLPGYPAHDYFAPAGSEAVAPVTGKVFKLSGHDPKLGAVQGAGGPLGWSVYIQGTDGRKYFLTHLGSRDVKVGQNVKAGQQIGTVADYDKFGRPSHIHLGVSG